VTQCPWNDKSLSLCIILYAYVMQCNMTGMYQSRDIVFLGRLIWGPGIPEHSYGDTSFWDVPSSHHHIPDCRDHKSLRDVLFRVELSPLQNLQTCTHEVGHEANFPTMKCDEKKRHSYIRAILDILLYFLGMSFSPCMVICQSPNF